MRYMLDLHNMTASRNEAHSVAAVIEASLSSREAPKFRGLGPRAASRNVY